MRVLRKAPVGGRSLKSMIRITAFSECRALSRETEDAGRILAKTASARLVFLERHRLELLDALLQRPHRVAARVEEPVLKVIVGRAEVLFGAGRVGDVKVEVRG